METKGIESMTREELIEFATSLNKEFEKSKKDKETYLEWWKNEKNTRTKLEEKIQAFKMFASVI